MCWSSISTLTSTTSALKILDVFWVIWSGRTFSISIWLFNSEKGCFMPSIRQSVRVKILSRWLLIWGWFHCRFRWMLKEYMIPKVSWRPILAKVWISLSPKSNILLMIEREGSIKDYFWAIKSKNRNSRKDFKVKWPRKDFINILSLIQIKVQKLNNLKSKRKTGKMFKLLSNSIQSFKELRWWAELLQL